MLPARSRWRDSAGWAILLVMGVSAWFFLRPRPGELRPLAQRAVEAFISDGGRIPAGAEGFVRYAQVIVSLQDRRALEVLRVGFFQYRALPDGTLDREHLSHWKPTQDELSKLRGLVNRKAGREIM